MYLVSLCLIGGRRGELGKGGVRALCEPLQGRVLKPKYNPRGEVSGGKSNGMKPHVIVVFMCFTSREFQMDHYFLRVKPYVVVRNERSFVISESSAHRLVDKTRCSIVSTAIERFFNPWMGICNLLISQPMSGHVIDLLTILL